MFTRSQVIVLTSTQTHTNPQANKQIPLKTCNILRYATTLGKHLTIQHRSTDRCNCVLVYTDTGQTLPTPPLPLTAKH